jgi:iron complex outermembrane receptor protein
MIKSNSRAALKLTAFAALLASTAMAQAQEQTQSPPIGQEATARAAPADGEILVTALRRSGTLERTPVSVSVLSADTLVKQAIVTESDLQIATPGLTIRAGYNSNQLNYALRGQSLDAFSDTRPGVLPYFNEVQLDGVGGGSTAFYDLQSIQVLKGPQGTLFGRNSTGGAVLFSSVKPSEDLGGYVSGRLGNYNAYQLEGALNVPLVGGKILARVAGFYEKRDGYQVNLFNNTRAGDVDRYGLRGSLTINLSDTITCIQTATAFQA